MDEAEELTRRAGGAADEMAVILEGLKEVYNGTNEGVWTSGDMNPHLARGSGIDGLARLIKKAECEMQFAKSMADSKVEATLARVKSTNMGIYDGVLKVLRQSRGVVGVQRTFSTSDKETSVEVDVIAGNGSMWIKVKSMTNKNIVDIMQGKGRFGERSVIDLAQDMMDVAVDNPINFGTPNCFIVFTSTDITLAIRKSMELSGVRTLLLDELHELAVFQTSLSPEKIAMRELAEELGEGMDTDEEEEEPAAVSEGFALNPLYVQTANLDVTAMFALTSDLTNGNNMYTFPSHKVLNGQAIDDRARPTLPILNAYLAGKRLIVCETAKREFLTIVNQVAGPEEKVRAAELLERCTVVPDNPSERSLNLTDSGRIKQRQKTVFGTGDRHHAVTLTANVQFVQAAIDQGVTFTVFVHAARALTERKRYNDGVPFEPANA
eukprot:TRINITY_DN20232_c0_g1_i1.p1 TRINITY_DN20232_c0_g1~~TRINITY_DN20232_c0_g1_i1.p1  ORF type:complete len:446 (+),score=144.44 TRINITY_DN20232_c0_g1_i1:30-1340(+)